MMEAPHTCTTGWTAFPNDLLDIWMPQLRDTEWRILCIIVRQTLGRAERTGGRRKAADWLTHSQLKARSGRASAAVSAAIERLVQLGLVAVTDDHGRSLDSTTERRRCAGRLCYRLTASASTGLTAPQPPTDVSFSECETRISQSENRKAKTTKERININIPNGSEQPVDNSVVPDVERFLATYVTLFREHSPQHEAPPVAWGKERRRTGVLLQTYAIERLEALLRQFFDDTSPWIRRSGYSLGAFHAALPALLMNDGAVPVRRPSTGLTRIGQHLL